MRGEGFSSKEVKQNETRTHHFFQSVLQCAIDIRGIAGYNFSIEALLFERLDLRDL